MPSEKLSDDELARIDELIGDSFRARSADAMATEFVLVKEAGRRLRKAFTTLTARCAELEREVVLLRAVVASVHHAGMVQVCKSTGVGANAWAALEAHDARAAKERRDCTGPSSDVLCATCGHPEREHYSNAPFKRRGKPTVGCYACNRAWHKDSSTVTCKLFVAKERATGGEDGR